MEHNPLLDRLVRSRTWIGLLAFALIGIVTLQLGLLKLNAGIGRTLEQISSLQQGNAALSIENSELAAGDRVEASAARLGMEIVPVGSLKSLSLRPRVDVSRAASALSTPVHVASTTETSTTETSAEVTPTSTSSSSTEQVATATGASESGESSPGATAESSSHELPPPTSESNSSSAGEATPAGGVQASPGG